MANKMTYKDALTIAIANLPNSEAEAKEKLKAMIAQLDKKNAAPKKLTAKQQETEAIKVKLLEEMVKGQRYTVSELLGQAPCLEGLSSQKVSAILRSLVQGGKVTRIEEKRKAYFSLAVEG